MGKNKITVIVPVLNQLAVTDKFLNYINSNVIIPERIILIDNGSTEDINSLVKKYNKLLITYIRHDKNIGVNSAWNEGIKLAETSFISILNNDILLNKFFFKKTIEAFGLNKNYGIVCGRTVKKAKFLNRCVDEPAKVEEMGKREGWAFSIRKEIIDRIDPIPGDLKTYCGDDYLYFCVRNLLGYKAVKVMNNYLYHYGGLTERTTKTNVIKEEKILWASHRKRLLNGKS